MKRIYLLLVSPLAALVLVCLVLLLRETLGIVAMLLGFLLCFVSDSESDIYELFSKPRYALLCVAGPNSDREVGLVVRACQNCVARTARPEPCDHNRKLAERHTCNRSTKFGFADG